MTDRRRLPRVAAGLLVLLLLTAGCGGGGARPRVRGKVIYHGNAVGGQTLALFSEGWPKEGSSQKIPINPDGTFSGEVSQPGTYKVVIEPSLAAQEGGAKASGPAIPAKYRFPATSTLDWVVTEGTNDRELDLKD
jgi:hypothetical protein